MGNWFSSSDELEKLNGEIKLLKAENAALKKRMTGNPGAGGARLSSISRAIIENLVNEQMEDPEKNIRWMPDGIERRIKTETLMLVANMFDLILESTKVSILGHKMRMDLFQPSSDKHD
jgi:hypothetical protein